MLKNFLLLISILLIFSSCSSQEDKKLKISVTTWVGYVPLFYAKEKGWLKELNIKLLNVSSLSENMYLYKAGNSDAFVGTQYEYGLLKSENKTLLPIMMFDKSFGGDIVMSNMSLDEIQNTKNKIDAYLEIDSINNNILEDFIKHYHIKKEQINYINKDQTKISLLESKNLKKPTLIITYVPYNTILRKNGFKELVSTKHGLKLLVVDAMFTTTKVYNQHKKQFIKLKKLLDKSIEALKKDPKEFYTTVKPYMIETTYTEFNKSLDDIIWINKKLDDDIKQGLQSRDFPTRDLL
jgi:NitT/TauT family transport system substrate-binding protein